LSKYLVIHAMASPIPVVQAEKVAKAVKTLSSSDAYWVSSWVQLDSKGDVAKILCEWDAKDLPTLKKTMEQAKNMFPDFPAEGPYPMMKVDGESYR